MGHRTQGAKPSAEMRWPVHIQGSFLIFETIWAVLRRGNFWLKPSCADSSMPSQAYVQVRAQTFKLLLSLAIGHI